MDEFIDALARDGEPWTEEEDKLLGTGPDRDVAAKLFRSSTSVRTRRVKLGVLAFKLRLTDANPDRCER